MKRFSFFTCVCLFYNWSILKFVNLQADAVKQQNSACLVTVGSWSEHAQTDTKAQSSIKFKLYDDSVCEFRIWFKYVSIRKLLHGLVFD